MGLQDRFRIDELVKKGSTAIRKDSNGNILVSKKDGKQKKPKLSSSVKRKFDKTKEDLANPQLVNPNENQTDFAGETSGYVEKPKYNEDELKKALDVKVDELIKKKKPNKGLVLAIGPLVDSLKAGDYVTYPEYAGSILVTDGEEYLIMREAEVLAVIG